MTGRLDEWLRNKTVPKPLVVICAFVIGAILLNEWRKEISPVIDVTAPGVVDLGDVQPGEKAKFQVSVKNRSNATLRIGQIEKSCSCTAITVGDPLLPPGAERTIQGQRVFGQGLGSRETLITIPIAAANGKTRKLDVRIRGRVTTTAVVAPMRVDFGKVDLSGGVRTFRVAVEAGNSGEKWNAAYASQAANGVSVRAEQCGPSSAHLVVSLDPSELPISQFSTTVTLSLTDNGRKLPKDIQLPITANISGPLKATPDSIFLRSVEPGTAIERIIDISSSGLNPAEIEVERSPKNISVRIDVSENGTTKAYLQIIPKAETGTFGETIMLHHRSSNTRLQIPIFGYIKSQTNGAR